MAVDDDVDRSFQEALRRSCEETTLEESLLADALAASLTTRDEELALAMQREQVQMLEARLTEELAPDDATLAQLREATRDMEDALQIAGVRPSSETAHRDATVGQPFTVVDRSRQRKDTRRTTPVTKTRSPHKNSPYQSSHYPRTGAAPIPSPTHRNGSASTYSDRASSSPKHTETPKPTYAPRQIRISQRPKNASAVPNTTARATFADALSANAYSTVSSSPDSSVPDLLESQSPNAMASLHVTTQSHPVAPYNPLSPRPNTSQHRASPSSATAPDPSQAPGRSGPESDRICVVIDGQNVGCSYGGGSGRFKSKGVELVLDYYKNKGIEAVAMLPRFKVDTRNAINNTRVADDPDLLCRLADEDRLSFTPSGAHDDNFLIAYAMSKNVDIISNDRFAKEVSLQETPEDQAQLRSFLNDHLIPYTFVHGDFVPNPKSSQLGRSAHESRRTRR